MNKNLLPPKIIVDVSFLEKEFGFSEFFFFKSNWEKTQMLYNKQKLQEAAKRLVCEELFGEYNPVVLRNFLEPDAFRASQRVVIEDIYCDQELTDCIRETRQWTVSSEYQRTLETLMREARSLRAFLESGIRGVPMFSNLGVKPYRCLDERSVVMEPYHAKSALFCGRHY